MEKQRYVKVSLDGVSYIDTVEGAARFIENEIRESDTGTVYTLESVEMSEAEFKALPEFEGF